MSESEGGSGFVAGFVLGGIAGAALALLLAPRTGDENRGALRERTIELRVRAEEAAARARVEADELLSRGKVILDEQRSRLQEAVDEGKEAATQKRSELLSRYRTAKESGELPETDELPPTTRPEAAAE
ncbi:MAG TPA: YtxH domain-containing protein [Chloroflexota bacterium]